jgi:hypothetical protein
MGMELKVMDFFLTLLFVLFVCMILILPIFVLLILGLAVKAMYDIKKTNYDL